MLTLSSLAVFIKPRTLIHEMVFPTVRWTFPPQWTQSRNSLTAKPGGLPPGWFYVLPSWTSVWTIPPAKQTWGKARSIGWRTGAMWPVCFRNEPEKRSQEGIPKHQHRALAGVEKEIRQDNHRIFKVSSSPWERNPVLVFSRAVRP